MDSAKVSEPGASHVECFMSFETSECPPTHESRILSTVNEVIANSRSPSARPAHRPEFKNFHHLRGVWKRRKIAKYWARAEWYC